MTAAIEITDVSKRFRLYHERYTSLKERLIHLGRIPFDEFWALVRAALAPDGRVFLVDSHRGDGAHTVPGGPDVEVRRLLDRREFRIVKRYYEPRALEERLAALGRRLTVATTAGGSLLYAWG